MPSLEGFRLLTPHLEVFEDRYYGFLCAAAYISKKVGHYQRVKKKKKVTTAIVSTLNSIPKSTIGDIWKDRVKIEDCVSASECSSVMKKKCIVREAVFAKVDQGCYEWFMQQCSRSFPITGPILRD